MLVLPLVLVPPTLPLGLVPPTLPLVLPADEENSWMKCLYATSPFAST